MKRLLIAAATLLALYCVPAARAQDDVYPAVNLTDPTNPANWASWMVNDLMFPYLGTDGILTDQSFQPFYQPGLLDGYVPGASVRGVTFGPDGLGVGAAEFVGSGGVSTISIINNPPGSHVALLHLYVVSHLSFGPMSAMTGVVLVHVQPFDAFHPQPGYSVWFPVGFPPIWPRPTYNWETSITVPPFSAVTAVFFGYATGCFLNDAVCPGIGTTVFIE